MKKKSWIKKNLVSLIFILIILFIVGYVVYANESGILQSLLSGIFKISLNQDDLDKLDLNPSGYSCKIDMPSSACVGDSVTSILTDGKNGLCRIAYKYNGGAWNFYGDVNTDSSGKATATDSPGTAGTYTFGAYCVDENGVICRTNDETIIVNDCPDSGDCVDSDGGDNKDTPGHITQGDDVYYDYCLESDPVYDLYEYYCLDGNWQGHKLKCDAGEECLQTRSGGYCREKSTEVGDNVGSETSGSGSANFGDDIITNNIMVDWNPEGSGYILGVKIWRTWSYVNPDDTTCQLPEQYPVEWTFYDTNGMAWQKYDYVPVTNAYDEVCPVTYHPDVPWKFTVSSGISCPINYNWRMQPFICEEA